MAELVIHLKRLLRCAAAFVGFALAVSPVASQELADPTRPPSAASSAGPAADSGPVLQSVLIAPGRKSAIISGKEVPLNGYYGKAKVIRITETEVVLRDGNNVRKLKLFPAVEKHKVQPGKTRVSG